MIADFCFESQKKKNKTKTKKNKTRITFTAVGYRRFHFFVNVFVIHIAFFYSNSNP